MSVWNMQTVSFLRSNPVKRKYTEFVFSNGTHDYYPDIMMDSDFLRNDRMKMNMIFMHSR